MCPMPIFKRNAQISSYWNKIKKRGAFHEKDVSGNDLRIELAANKVDGNVEIVMCLLKTPTKFHCSNLQVASYNQRASRPRKSSA